MHATPTDTAQGNTDAATRSSCQGARVQLQQVAADRHIALATAIVSAYKTMLLAITPVQLLRNVVAGLTDQTIRRHGVGNDNDFDMQDHGIGNNASVAITNTHGVLPRCRRCRTSTPRQWCSTSASLRVLLESFCVWRPKQS